MVVSPLGRMVYVQYPQWGEVANGLFSLGSSSYITDNKSEYFNCNLSSPIHG